jgi:hypothetical protein
MKSAIVLFASLAGALTIHVTLSACGNSGGTARAQTAPACTAWQTAESPGTAAYEAASNLTTFTIPAGWEPIAELAAADSSRSPTFLVRRCAAQ